MAASPLCQHVCDEWSTEAGQHLGGQPSQGLRGQGRPRGGTKAAERVQYLMYKGPGAAGIRWRKAQRHPAAGRVQYLMYGVGGVQRGDTQAAKRVRHPAYGVQD